MHRSGGCRTRRSKTMLRSTLMALSMQPHSTRATCSPSAFSFTLTTLVSTSAGTIAHPPPPSCGTPSVRRPTPPGLRGGEGRGMSGVRTLGQLVPEPSPRCPPPRAGTHDKLARKVHWRRTLRGVSGWRGAGRRCINLAAVRCLWLCGAWCVAHSGEMFADQIADLRRMLNTCGSTPKSHRSRASDSMASGSLSRFERERALAGLGRF